MWLFNPAEPTAQPVASGVLSQDYGATDFCPTVPPLWSLTVNLVPTDNETEIYQRDNDVGIVFDRKVIGGSFELIGKFNYGTFPAFTATADQIEERINAKHAAELGYTVYLGRKNDIPTRLNPFTVRVSGEWPLFEIAQPSADTTLEVFGYQIGENYGSPDWSILDNLEREVDPFLFFPESNGSALLARDLQVVDVNAPTEFLTDEQSEIYFDNFFRTLGSLAVWRENRNAEQVDDDYRFQLLYGVDYGTSLDGVADPSPWSLLFGPYYARYGFAAPFCAWFAEDTTGIPSQFPGLQPWRFSTKLVTDGSETLFAEFPASIDLNPRWW